MTKIKLHNESWEVIIENVFWKQNVVADCFASLVIENEELRKEMIAPPKEVKLTLIEDDTNIPRVTRALVKVSPDSTRRIVQCIREKFQTA